MPIFEEFEDETDLDDILERLKNDDAVVRKIAVLDLSEITNEISRDALINCLSDSSPQVRLEAARSLESFDVPIAVSYTHLTLPTT